MADCATGRPRSSQSRTSAGTVAGLRPDVATTTNGFSALTKRAASSRMPPASGAGRARHAELVEGRKARARGLGERYFARNAEIDRAARLGAGNLQGARHHQPGVVLEFQVMVPLGVLPHDAVLVEGLLQPEMALRLARAGHAAGIGDRRDAGRDQHRQPGVPGGVDRAAVVLRAAVDVCGGRDRLAADCSAAERSVQAGVLVRDRDQPRRLAALRLGLGDRLLVEADLRSRGEEHVLDAGLRHSRDDRLAVVCHGDFDPGAARVAAIVDVVHGGVLDGKGCAVCRF